MTDDKQLTPLKRGNEYMSPLFKKATLFVLIPAVLLLTGLFFFDLFSGEMDIEGFFTIIGFLAILIVPIFIALYPKKTDKIVKNISDKTEPINKNFDKFFEDKLIPAIGGFFILCFRVLFVVACLYGLRALVRFLIY